MVLSLLETSIPLPFSKTTNVQQYSLPAAALPGIDGVAVEVEIKRIIKRTHSPYNSLVWPVKKPIRQWLFTVDYRHLNTNTASLTTAVPNIAEVVTII